MFLKTILLCFGLLSCSLCSSKSVLSNREMLHEGIRKFAVNLNRVMVQETGNDENVVFSPLSLYISLALAHLAANGQTQEEIRNAMCLPRDSEWSTRVHENLSNLIHQLQNDAANANITVANGMFVNKNLNLKNTFLEQVQKYYDSYLEKVDFNGNDATDIVNRWFNTKTNGQIAQFIDEPIPTNTKVLLANALCFGGRWNNDFPEGSTEKDTFECENGDVQQVTMMRKNENVPYFNDPNNQYEAIGVPFQQNEYQMYLVLPRQGNHIRDLMERFDSEHIQRIVRQAQNVNVDIKMPQMRLQHNNKMRETLVKLGINQLFQSADLSNMVSDRNINVAQVSHSFQMDVNEKGMDVCVGTAQEYRPKAQRPISGDETGKQFYLQRPFMFFVYHSTTESVLFYGTVNNNVSNPDE